MTLTTSTPTTIANWHDADADLTWITKRIAVGGGIFGPVAMADVARQGVTHIISLAEFDETSLAAPHGIAVLHAHVEDDFTPKSPAWFARGVKFAKAALAQKGAKVLVHCAAGIHRGPLMTLALLCATGWGMLDAMRRIERRRPQVDFPNVYLDSVRAFLRRERL
jgi:protein-tyrosine phosphatase